LTTQQVRERHDAGFYNEQVDTVSKTGRQIVLGHIFTFFNMLNLTLATLVIIVGSFKNIVIIGIVTLNTLVSIFQEFRAKKTLDNLSLIASSKATVVRDGQSRKIPVDEVVLDDVMVLSAGDQICAGAIVRDGTLEVNESLLTGEAEVILKKPGDALYAGSYVVSGKAYTQVDQVGKDNLSYTITKQAKSLRQRPSELRRSINRILKAISVIIVPLGVSLYAIRYYVSENTFASAVEEMVSAMVGMIPEGLVLLTTAALVVGVIKLARQKTLVHDLFCIETLARVDMLCLDKTGTITEGVMQVGEMIPLTDAPFEEILGNLVNALPDTNATFIAIKNKFHPYNNYTASAVVPFSSERKFSGVSFHSRGSYIIGAFEFIFPQNAYPEVREQAMRYTRNGMRVITLAHSKQMMADAENQLPKGLIPYALLLIHDTIREDAPQTLKYFDEQGVGLMVISGDHPATVAHIAAKAGLPGADRFVDAATLTSPEDIADAVREYRVFGRVTPSQKKEIVVALREEGYTVAMTGDGVNDVPALKEADCGIAMAEGSDAAKSAADLVLLSSNFSAMPHIVNEGRRVVNNIQNAAALFLVKTFFSIILTVLTLIFRTPYPFAAFQLSVMNIFAVGIPTFILSMEPNFALIKPGFFKNVVRNALTGALTVIIFVITVTGFTAITDSPEGIRNTVIVIIIGIVALYMIRMVYPLTNWLRKTVFTLMFGGYLVAMVITQKYLELIDLPYAPLILLISLVVVTPKLIESINAGLGRIGKLFARDEAKPKKGKKKKVKRNKGRA